MQPAGDQFTRWGAVSTVAAVFKSVQNRQSEICNRKFVGSCSKTRTTSSAPAPRVAQLHDSVGKVTAEKFNEVFKKSRALFID